MTGNDNLLHWLSVDWAKNHNTLNNGLGIPLINRFACFLNAPKSAGGYDAELFNHNAWLEMQVLSADVPNFSIDPVEQELNGTRRFYFKGRSDSDLGITFLETPSLLLRRFFYDWMQMAIDISSESGVKRRYMNQYMPSPSEFILFPLDVNGQALFCDRFINVFPYDVSGISYNYAEAGEIIKTTVKFKYMYHYISKMDSTKSYHSSAKSNMAITSVQ